MQVRSGSKNVALGKPVTALDSIEAAPSWAKINLVDGYSSTSELASEDGGGRSARRILEDKMQAARNERSAVVDRLLDEPTRTETGRCQAWIERR